MRKGVMKEATRKAMKDSRLSANNSLQKRENRCAAPTTGRKERQNKAMRENGIGSMLTSAVPNVRKKAFKFLTKWLMTCNKNSIVLTTTQIGHLWKSLFYCMWLCAKPCHQEELAESISQLIHCFDKKDSIVRFINCGFKILACKWYSLEHVKVDKFAMLTRRILRQMFVVCKKQSWNYEWIKEISQIFKELFVCPAKNSIGFNMHITEIYLEELAKICKGYLPEGTIIEFLKPFVVYLVTTRDEREMKQIMRCTFRYLIFQSNVGLDYAEKFAAWRAAGFPCTHVDDMKKIEITDTEEVLNENEQLPTNTETENEIERPLDPRAGRVNVDLPQIPFDATQIVQLLLQYKFHPSSTSKSRRQLSRLVEEFKELSEGRMPLGIKKVRKTNYQKKDTDSKKAARRLLNFEKKLSDKVSRKRKNSEQLHKSDTSFLACQSNKDISNVEGSIGSRNKTIDMTMKNDSQSTDVNPVVPPKKQKKEELGIKDLPNKTVKVKRVKLKCINDVNEYALVTDNKIKRTVKKAAFDKWQVSDINLHTSPTLVSQSNRPPKKTINEKTTFKNINNYKATRSKEKVTSQIKEKLNLKKEKKVQIALNRNTAHHTSDYIKQVLDSPAIPYNADKKPLPSVLKPNCIPSPVNPFYRKNLYSSCS